METRKLVFEVECKRTLCCQKMSIGAFASFLKKQGANAVANNYNVSRIDYLIRSQGNETNN